MIYSGHITASSSYMAISKDSHDMVLVRFLHHKNFQTKASVIWYWMFSLIFCFPLCIHSINFCWKLWKYWMLNTLWKHYIYKTLVVFTSVIHGWCYVYGDWQYILEPDRSSWSRYQISQLRKWSICCCHISKVYSGFHNAVEILSVPTKLFVEEYTSSHGK